MKKLLCVALLFICTTLTACGNEAAQFDGYVEDDGVIEYYDNTNVALEVIEPAPTEEPVEPATPVTNTEPVSDFVDDGTVYTLTITGIEYTGTITEIIAQLPVNSDGTYHLHVPGVCSIITDAYNLPGALLDIAGKVYALNNPVEPVYDKATVEEAQSYIDSYGSTVCFNSVNYEIIACCNLKDRYNSPEQYLFVGSLIYYDADTNTYNFMGIGIECAIPVNSLEELHVWVEENVNNDDLYTWTYFN